MSKKGMRLGASVTSLVAALSPAAFAQDAAPAEEEVVITGSFIRGTPEDAALPVDVIGQQELEKRGGPSMVQLIKTIPSSGAVIGENNRFGAGNGTSTINLRNLNSASTGARTLVLFNGKRMATSNRSLGSVDLNLLPSGAIGRLEVLKDGAAATYGSDAIAGVVNLITRRGLEGFEVGGQYQFIDGSEGDYNANALFGHRTENADLLFAVEYAARSELPITEREWALRRGDAGFLANPLGGWAGTGNPGVYVAPSVAPAGSPNTGFTSAAAFAAGGPDGSTATTADNPISFVDIGCAANGGAPRSQATGPFTLTGANAAACAFQYTAFDNLVENEDRLKAYGELNVDLSDNLKFNANALWARNETPLQSWALTGPNQFPTPILASGGSTGGGSSPVPASGTGEQSNFYIPATHPGLQQLLAQITASNCAGAVLPFGNTAANCATIRANSLAAVTNAASFGLVSSSTSWRPNGIGGAAYEDDLSSHYTYKTDTWRVGGGFTGTTFWDIGWDANVTFQQLDYKYNLEDTSVNRLQLALRGFGSREGAADQCTPAEAAIPANAGNAAVGCYYFNPFTNGYAQVLPDSSANPFYVATNGAITGFNDMQAARADVQDWMVEKQFNTLSDRTFEANFILNGELPISIAGADNVAWAAGAQMRYDQTVQNPDVAYDANATPCVDSPPFGDAIPPCPTTANGPFLFNANLRPYDVDRTIYSAFGEVKIPLGEKLEVTGAARYEEYQGFGETFNPKIAARWQALDWLALRGSASTTYRAPRATFVTNTFSRGLTNASGTYRSNDLYGNANLEAEEAVTYSTGLLFDNDRIKASVDYWNFDFKNPMTTESTADMVARMFPGGSTARCTDAIFDALEARFTFSGAGCAGGTGAIVGYRTQYINGGGVKTSGVDFQVNADLFEIGGGELSAGFDGTYLLTYDEKTSAIEGVYANATAGNAGSPSLEERVGTFRASLFTGYNETRANAYVNFALGDHNLRWQTRYISGTRQVESTPLALAAALNASGIPTTTDVPEYYQHDVTYRMDIPSVEAQLNLSVQNVFDEEPPFAFGTQYNYDPGSGNPLGRVIAVSVKKQF